MTADNFYWYAGILIFVPWGLLVLAPNGRYTDRVAFAAAFVLLCFGAWFTIQYLFSPDGDGGSVWSLEGLSHLFRSKEMLLTGWLNYLSFCLFAGGWQSHDSRQLDLPHVWVVPCLLLTMLAGPSGLLLYMLLRWVKTRRWGVEEGTGAKRRK